MKHTPGPWTIALDAPEDGWVVVLRKHQEGVIALCELRDQRLIAAAPELLEAAKYALKCLDAANETLGGWDSSPYYVEARADLKKAIAKAEGRESD